MYGDYPVKEFLYCPVYSQRVIMAVPAFCKELETKFQDAVREPPKLPIEIRMNDVVNVPWEVLQSEIRGEIQKVHLNHISYPGNPRNMAGGIWRSTYAKLRDNANIAGVPLNDKSMREGKPQEYMKMVEVYATKVHDANKKVIECINTLPQANRIRQEVGEWSIRPGGPAAKLAMQRFYEDQGGRRRKTKKSKRHSRKTRRSRK
jgi:hypothetical protein